MLTASTVPTKLSTAPVPLKETDEIFELLLGDNLAGRKKYIADYGKFYIKDADI